MGELTAAASGIFFFMKQIPLTQGKFALVDDEDFEHLSKFKWFAIRIRNVFYAARNPTIAKNKQKLLFMHRHILGVSEKSISIDHIDRNGLNNQRNNLRQCTSAQNQQNRAMPKNNTSGFKGVCKHRNKWEARIAFNRQRVVLGYFDTPKEAAVAYNKAATIYHGSFAVLNKV